MRSADRIVEAAHLATVDPVLGRLDDGAVAIREGLIVDVGPAEVVRAAWTAPLVDRHPRALMVPGLVDVHLHPGLYFLGRLAATPVPGRPGLLARGGQIERFLNLLGALHLDPDQTLVAARASLLRALESGVTYFNDAAAGDTDALAVAAAEIGLSGVLTYDFGFDLDFDLAGDRPRPRRIAEVDRLLARAEAVVASHHGRNGMQCWYNLLCDLNASDELYRETTRLARRDGVGINTHTATVRRHEEASRRDYGVGSVRRLLDLGVLGPHWIGAHMGFIPIDDLGDLAASGAHVAHCPATSMGSGKGIIANGLMRAMQARGINIALGTDSAQWPDLPAQMSLAYFAHKEVSEDDTVFNPDSVLRMATLAGAIACGVPDERGSISIGKLADLVLVDTDNLAFAPFADPLLGWMRSGRGVQSVYVEGRCRVRGGVAVDLDRDRVLVEARGMAETFGLRRHLDRRPQA